MTVKVGRFCMKNHREDDYGLFLWISWTFRDGLFVECLMDCLEWISAELDWISAAICVCVGRSRKPWSAIARFIIGDLLFLRLSIVWFFSGLLLW